MKKFMTQVKDKTIKELAKQEQTVRAEIAKMTLQQKVNPPKNTNELFRKKKSLAVVLTVLHAKRELEKLQVKKAAK